MLKKKLRRLMLFANNYGYLNGLRLFTEFERGKLSQIQMPGFRHPFALRKGTSDIQTFYQVYLDNEYNLVFSQPPKVIIDGGANVGLFALQMKNRFPDAKIICIEPDPENFQLLQKNTEAYDGISCENSGIWNKDTKLKVYDKYGGGKWGMTVEENLTEGNINAVSIDSLFAKYNLEHVDVLKLDIETSEKQVFSEGYESWLPKVKTVVIELHDGLEEGCSKAFFTAINKCFKNYRYSVSGENTIITNLDS
jgi:FkbM family methyltransferase